MKYFGALGVGIALLLASASLQALFTDWSWYAPLATIIVLTVVTGVAFRSIPTIGQTGLTVLFQFVLSFIVAVILCAPREEMLAGFIPTGSAFGSFFNLLSAGISDAYTVTVPTPSTPGLNALLVVAFALLTMLIDSLVNDLRLHTIAAILLLLAWALPVFLAAEQLQWWHFALLGAGFIIILLTAYAHVIAKRAPFLAAVAGALALVLGVALPLLMPPISPQNRQARNQDLTVINPFLDLRDNLGENSNDPVFEYSSVDPLDPPIRLTSVSEFDGQTWAPATFPIQAGNQADLGLGALSGIDPDVAQIEYTGSFAVGSLGGQHLPVPYAPTGTQGLSEAWIFDPETRTIVGNGEEITGQEYSATYLSVEPTAEQLQAAAPVNTSQFSAALSLPDNLPEVVADTAAEVTAGAETEWEKAVALQEYFRSDEFTYSLDAPDDASGNAIADFLRDKRGYCVQFSGAMAAMARTLGIPARIGVGFTAGDETSDGRYTVTMQHSHAWPELYFEGAGWVRFEPTPGGPAGSPPPWTTASAPQEEPTAEPSEEPTAEPSDSATETGAEPTAGPTEEETGEGEQTEGSNTTFALPAWVWVAVVVLVLLVLVLVPAILRSSQRSQRLRSPLDPEAVWTEIRATEIDFGHSRASSLTVRRHAVTLQELIPQRNAEIQAVVNALEALRYAEQPDSRFDVDATGLMQDLRQALATAAGRGRAFKAWIWPRSLWTKF